MTASTNDKKHDGIRREISKRKTSVIIVVVAILLVAIFSPLIYKSLYTYYNVPVLVLSKNYADWWMTQSNWDNYGKLITPIANWFDIYAQNCSQILGFTLNLSHFIINDRNPLGNKIVIHVFSGGLGGNATVNNFNNLESVPIIGIGSASFTTPIHGIKGYYAYALIAHEYWNVLNAFGPCNIPSWLADLGPGKHSPWPYTIKTYPMLMSAYWENTTGNAEMGAWISQIAKRELANGISSDVGVATIDSWIQTYGIGFVGRMFQAFRSDEVGLGRTIYGISCPLTRIITYSYNKTTYIMWGPTIDAYFEMYCEYAAGTTLNWSSIDYKVPPSPLMSYNATLVADLLDIYRNLLATRNNIVNFNGSAVDLSSLNATYQEAMMYWRQGYYSLAEKTLQSN